MSWRIAGLFEVATKKRNKVSRPRRARNGPGNLFVIRVQSLPEDKLHLVPTNTVAYQPEVKIS